MDMYLYAGGNYLRSEDVPPQGIYGTIQTVREEEIRGDHGKERKAILYFSEAIKPIVLNKTNVETCISRLGNHSEAWAGQRVGIRVEQVQFGGKTVPGIRLFFDQAPSAPAVSPPPNPAAPAPVAPAAPVQSQPMTAPQEIPGQTPPGYQVPPGTQAPGVAPPAPQQQPPQQQQQLPQQGQRVPQPGDPDYIPF